MLMKVWFLMVRFVSLIGWVTALLMRLLILVGGGSVLLLPMLVVTSLEVCGRWYPVILDLHRFFIAISRAVVNHDGNKVLLLILWFGLLVLCQKGDGWFM